MKNRLDEYHDQMVRREREAAELRRLSDTPRVRPVGIGADVDETLVPRWLMRDLRAASVRGEWPWYFHADRGRGVECTAWAIYRHWSGSAVWMSFAEFCEREMRQSWSRSVGLIVVHEIRPIAGQSEKLGNLLASRKGKPLILTGRLFPEQLSAFGEEVQSRVMAGKAVDFRGRGLVMGDGQVVVCERGLPVTDC